MPSRPSRSHSRPTTREERHIRGVIAQTLGGALLIAAMSGMLMLASTAWRVF